MSSIGMVINTTEKRGCCVLSNVLSEMMATSRVIIKEIRNIVYKTRYQYQRSLGRLFLDYGSMTC